MMQAKVALHIQAKECMGNDCDVGHADSKPHKEEEMVEMMKSHAADTLKADCKGWCASGGATWDTKCGWAMCSACSDCGDQPSTFTVVADEFLDPACDSTEVKDSWANVDSEAECQEKVLAAGLADANVNYGVWRGDGTNECQTCMIHANRFAVDYVDLAGAVSFVKPAACKDTCANHAANWETKCRWENQECSGCSDCAAVACTSVGCPACESYCETTTQSWETKCGYSSKDCRGCSACSQEVEAGVFTLQSSTTGAYLSDGDTGVVQSSSAMDGNSQWWFRLNMTTGLYSIKNVDRGLYLSVSSSSADTPVQEVVFQQAAELNWDTQLDGERRTRRYTLMDSSSGKYLDVASTGNGIIQSDNAEAWIFNTLSESEVATPSPTLAVLPSIGAMEFYFGSSIPSSAASGAILDTGVGYGQNTASGYNYGWNCDGDSNVNYAGGIRDTGRAGGLGLNHFDRSNTCKDGSTYKKVNWELQVPNGDYSVEVVFPEGSKSGCEVEGVNAGCGSSSCTVSKTVSVTDGLFTVTGYGHDSALCHSLGKVQIEQVGDPAPTPAQAPAILSSMEFYFGSSLPSSAASGAVLDAGTGYGTSSTSGGQSYGWDCDGDSSGINYAGGIRDTGRGSGLGLNHFDRSNTCKDGSTYKPVNWQLEVPNGQYDVQVVFAESYKSGCAVEGVNAGCGNSYCDVSKTVAITDGKFTVTGYGHDSGLCHSLSKVAIQQASSSLLLTQRTKPSTLNDTGKILHHKDAVLSKTVEAHKINEHEPVYTGEEGTRKRLEVEQLKHKMKEETEDTEDNKRDLKDLEEGLKAIQDEITQKTHQKQ